MIDHPEKRVQSYISHWYKQWTIANEKMKGEIDFDYWANLISEVDKLHFTNGSVSGTAESFSSLADHNPDKEKITRSSIDEHVARVETETNEAGTDSTKYRAYELLADDNGNWLITEILLLYNPPQELVIEKTRHKEILSLSELDTPLEQIERIFNLDENLLFQNNRSVVLPELDTVKSEVTPIGYFNTRSGILGVLDFGYDIYDFEPLDRRIQPGKYIVETVSVDNYIAGVRIRFDVNKTPKKWFAAKTSCGNGIYGVDAGNLAIVDVESLMGLCHLDKERLFNKWVKSREAVLLSMTDENDCLITSSGFGDGDYPAQWGVCEDDEIVSLYVDFMILVNETEDGVYTTV